MQLFLYAVFLALSALAQGHIMMLEINGANGVTGQPFGVDPTTPRDGSTPNPFERDTTIFKRGAPSGCGKTKQSGALDCTQEATKQVAAAGGQLPTSSGGEIAVTMHQVNQDGAGPMKAFVDPTGTGNNFQTAKVTKNVPGIGGLSLTTATDFPVTVQMPAGMTCDPMCLVRVQNPIGPFGGTAAFTDNTTKTTAARAMLHKRMLEKRMAAKFPEFR